MELMPLLLQVKLGDLVSVLPGHPTKSGAIAKQNALNQFHFASILVQVKKFCLFMSLKNILSNKWLQEKA